MANWFKIYETDLDEKRLKWALNKLPEVGWVFIGILSECCKHSSDTIRWSPLEHDLFGFSDSLKVSIPKINEAINLLVTIDYIEKGKDSIRVKRWNEKQSEYNHRKQRGDYRRLSDNIGDSPLEERRGEESRREKSKVASLPKHASNAAREKPTLEAVKLVCSKTGLPESDAVWFWNKCEGNGWTNGGKPIKSWPHVIAAWKAAGYMPSQKQHPNGQPMTIADRNIAAITRQLDREDERRAKQEKDAEPLDMSWMTRKMKVIPNETNP